jgi:hypothetical protein
MARQNGAMAMNTWTVLSRSALKRSLTMTGRRLQPVLAARQDRDSNGRARFNGRWGQRQRPWCRDSRGSCMSYQGAMSVTQCAHVRLPRHSSPPDHQSCQSDRTRLVVGRGGGAGGGERSFSMTVGIAAGRLRDRSGARLRRDTAVGIHADMRVRRENAPLAPFPILLTPKVPVVALLRR